MAVPLDAPWGVGYARIDMSRVVVSEPTAVSSVRQRTRSCLSSLLLLAIVVIVMLAVIGNGSRTGTPNGPAGQTAASNGRLEEVLSKPELPTLVPTAQVPPTWTPASTPTALPTATAVPPTPTTTPTQTPSPTATATAVPPTETAVALIIPAPEVPTALPTPRDAYSWTLKVPILMYHYLSVPPEDADIYRTDLSVTPENFRIQMQYLAENGYTPVDLYDLSMAILGLKELPPKPVVLTFDDGYIDNYTNAFPILQEFGFTATFFVVTEFVDMNREGYMTWNMIREIAAAGNRIEPHSRTHPDMRGLSREKLIWEILGPQETIAYHIGYTPRFFNYPAGRYDEAVIQILQELNFWGAVTTMGGHWHGYEDRFEWRRVRIRFNTPLAEFIDVVEPDDTVGGKLPSP